ncbi:MAG: penicillin-binding transpeptidase domain-containing protein [Pelolinea sp.]|nr:penicillin-binding transpeptidase domain-containing protein [Pelolinea sp.]
MKKNVKLLVLVLSLLILTSCAKQASGDLPTPQVLVSTAPEVDATVESFLSLWVNGEYDQMYQMVSSSSRQEISDTDFVTFYEQTASNATLRSIETQLLSSMKNPNSATAKYRVVFNTSLFGSFEREIDLTLALEENTWKVNWDPGLILPELAGGNRLQLETISADRGSIYARDGQLIVDQTTAYALAIIPNEIEDGKEGVLLNYLSDLTGRTTESIQASYEDIRRTNWYVAVGEVSANEIEEQWDAITALGGIRLSEFQSRYYYNGGIASQAIGYLSSINPEQVEDYRALGYMGDEYIGQAGVEKYAEEALAGKPAASLYVVNETNQIISYLNQADAKLPQDITTTFDKDLQIEAQKALLGLKGAIVVMEVETGRILAMASSPGYDPNLFTPENANSAELLDDLLNDGQQRLLNRVTQGSYPAGSIFKVIGMAAALESDLYTPDTTYFCGSYFEELPGEKFKDWTVDKELPPSGTLTLVQGLTRSCNPWFYHIGLDLFRQKGADYLSNFARGFGLGSATGIDQVAEVAGQIVDPASDGDAVQQGIGQGDMLVTPLQVVRFTAALANGGTLYRPQIIERITSSNGVDVYTFSPLAQSELPVSRETLDAISDGMRGVVRSSIGTANDELGDLSIVLYGKTGTAENPLGDSHAWFTGYSSTVREDKPDIAVTVIIENGGEGSAVGAPVFRRVIETYYYGEPLKLYPWESKFNVTRTPTPEFTETPPPGAIPPASSGSSPGQQVITPTPSG